MGLWNLVTTGGWNPPPPPRRWSPPPVRTVTPPPPPKPKTVTPPPPPPSKLLTEPWTPANPFKEDVSTIKQKVLAPALYGNRKKYNILIVGQVGAGKSSFVNSLITVTNEDEDDFTDAAEVRGSGAHSTSFELREYPLGDKVTIFDMPGYDNETTDIQVNVDLYHRIFEGKIKDKKDLRRDIASLEEDPERTIDAIIIVFDSAKITSNPTATVAMPVYKALVEACIHRHIRYTVVLTKVDQLCEEVHKDLTKVYLSKAVAKMALSIHEKIGLNKKFIIPIRNYVDEYDRNPNMDKLILHTVKVTVKLAQDYAKYNTGKNVPSTNCGEEEGN